MKEKDSSVLFCIVMHAYASLIRMHEISVKVFGSAMRKQRRIQEVVFGHKRKVSRSIYLSFFLKYSMNIDVYIHVAYQWQILMMMKIITTPRCGWYIILSTTIKTYK